LETPFLNGNFITKKATLMTLSNNGNLKIKSHRITAVAFQEVV
jgi:hypothetical protein